MRITTPDNSHGVQSWFNYYFNGLKVGLVMSMLGNQHLKSGIGKSWTAIKMGEVHDPDYLNGIKAIDKIVFRPRDFTKAMEIIEADKRPGQVVVIDEAGILVNAKKWYSFINRAMSDAVMTFRNLRGMAIFVTPGITMIEKDIRLFVSHMGICDKTLVYDQSHHLTPEVQMFLYKLHWDDVRVKYYRYRLTMYNKETHRLERYRYFRVHKPVNDELLAEYEKRAAKYKREVRSQVADLDNIEKDFRQLADEILEDHRDLVKPSKIGGVMMVHMDDVKEELDVSFSKARMIARRVNEKLKEEAGMGRIVA